MKETDLQKYLQVRHQTGKALNKEFEYLIYTHAKRLRTMAASIVRKSVSFMFFFKPFKSVARAREMLPSIDASLDAVSLASESGFVDGSLFAQLHFGSDEMIPKSAELWAIAWP